MSTHYQQQGNQGATTGGAAKGESPAVRKSADQGSSKQGSTKGGQKKKPEGSPAKPSRPETMPAGIAGAAFTQDAVAEVKRMVPVGEPGGLGLNSDLKWIGKPVPRLDGPLKTTGSARYTADVYLPGMLYATLLSSSEPHARIRNIDTSAAAKAPGVKGVYILKHLSDQAELIDATKEIPSKFPIVRYAGQPILGVAAMTQQQAEDAARMVKIDFEPLPFVTDLDQARRADAPVIYPGPAVEGGSAGGGGGPENVPQKGNVRGPALGPRGGEKGSTEQGFKEADATVERTYRTQVQTHSALETHGVVADWKPDGVTVYASTQGTSTVRDEIAEFFNIPKSKVRVITEYMGGGFGAKFGAGNFGVIATSLSKQTGAPVKLMLSRKQEHLSVGNRPNSEQMLKIGAKKDGTLTAMHLVSYGTGGVGTGAGCAGPVQNMYTKCPNILTEEYDVFTNAGPAASMRAPGHPQGAFALEQAIDELAVKLDIDPLKLRDLNDEHPARREERRIGAELSGWSNRHAPGADSGPVKRGLGMAQSVWYRIVNKDSGAEVRISRDGAVQVLSGVQDIGGGIRTVMAQIVAEELGLDPHQITVNIGDTNYPQGPPSGGSMTTASITPAVRDAAYKARMQMAQQLAPRLNTSADQVRFANGKVGDLSFKSACSRLNTDEIAARAERAGDYTSDPGAGSGSKSKSSHVFYGGAQFAQVAVDTETGKIWVEKVWAIHDCGRPMNSLYLESQINGGILQGISYALYEERIIDRNTGIMVNPNLEEYKIIGSREAPEIHVHVLEDYLALSSTDAGGIGEPSTVPTSGAIANAVFNATGARVTQLPMKPSVVLAALAEARKNEPAKGAQA